MEEAAITHLFLDTIATILLTSQLYQLNQNCIA